MGLLSFLFKKKAQKIKELLTKGAVILDVRTKGEWDKDHIENAVHIPLNELKNNIEYLKSLNKPIIAHCQSGVRSKKATILLKSESIEAVNGGGLGDMKRLI